MGILIGTNPCKYIAPYNCEDNEEECMIVDQCIALFLKVEVQKLTNRV